MLPCGAANAVVWHGPVANSGDSDKKRTSGSLNHPQCFVLPLQM